MFKPQGPFQILEILVSVKDDNPIEENKTYLVPHCGLRKQRGAGALSVDHQDPSAEGSEGSKVEWEAEEVQVYSVLRI